MHRLSIHCLLYSVVAFSLCNSAYADIAPPRTLEELKAETQARADRNAYPLTGLRPDEVREALAAIKSLDRDAWAAAWSAIGDRYLAQARAQEKTAPAAARENYLQAWRYYSFARWPVPNSPGKQKAYRRALDAFQNYTRFLDPPLEVVRIPFEKSEIIGYLRLPAGVRPAPLVLMISALDSRKEDLVERGTAFLAQGIGVFALDMPGTGQAPINIDVGAERMYSRTLDYLVKRNEIDPNRIIVYGGSWGGHWSARLAFIERARLKGAVAQGAPVHDYFQPEWQRKALGTREYLFDLFAARASVYGVQTLEEFLTYGPRMSLKDTGIISQPSVPMLLINGERDTQVPIADLDLLLHNGSPKEAWVNPQGGHMGRSAEWPDAAIFNRVVVPWVVHTLEVTPGKH